MNPNREAVAQTIAVLVASFPSAKLAPENVAAYVNALEDLSPRALGLAIRTIQSRSKFFPTISEIREAALASTTALVEQTAEVAWGQVLAAISEFGWARPPRFDDPLVERALQCTIGWYDLCTSDLSDGPSHRARFIAAYENLHRRALHGGLLPERLREDIANSRKDFIAGTLGRGSQQDYISDQRREALKLLRGVGEEHPLDNT